MLRARNAHFRLLALLSLLAVGVMSCGGDTEPAEQTTTSAETTTSTTPSSTTTEAPAEDEGLNLLAEEDDRSLYGIDLSGLELPGDTPYEEYVLVEDDTQQVEVQVPTDWSDVDTTLGEREGVELPGVWASTDLEAFVDGYSVPGAQVDLRSASSHEELVDLLNSDNATNENCEGPEEFDYDDGLYTGVAELWTDCGEDGAALLEVVALRGSSQYITVEVQMLTDPDVDAALRAVKTFRAVALEEDIAPVEVSVADLLPSSLGSYDLEETEQNATATEAGARDGVIGWYTDDAVRLEISQWADRAEAGRSLLNVLANDNEERGLSLTDTYVIYDSDGNAVGEGVVGTDSEGVELAYWYYDDLLLIMDGVSGTDVEALFLEYEPGAEPA